MNNLKTVSVNENELRVGNYMVLFGGRDLVNEYFTKNTKFDSTYTDLGVLYVDFEHGQDPDGIGNNANNVLGVVDWKSARVDDNGIYVERILNRRAGYMQFLEELIKAGVVGTSSAAVPRSTKKTKDGEIVEWPLMRDSLTVTPMEPRMVGDNVLSAAKSLFEIFPHSKSLAALNGVKTSEEMAIKAIAEIKNYRDAEKFLRDSGISRSEAVAFVSRIKSLGQSDSGSGLKEVIAALKKRGEAIAK